MHTVVRVALSMIIGLRMVVLYRALRAASPPNEPLVYQKTTVRYRVVRGRRRTVEAVHVGIEAPDRVRFRLQPETDFDRRAKRLGLATEWQVNDQTFDNNVFIVSDDPIFLRALSEDRELRKHAIALMNTFGCPTIRCSAGCLWVEAKPNPSAESQEDSERIALPVVNRTLRHLLAIRERLHAINSTAWDPTRDRSLRVEIALYVVLEVLGVLGIIAFLLSGGRGEHRQLLYLNTGLWATGITLAIAAVVLPMFISITRKSSSAHLLLFEMVVVGVPGVAGLAFGGACWVNRHEDSVPAVEHVVQIEDRYITTGRRNRKNYHLIVDWPDPRVDKDFSVSAEIYREYDTTRCAEVVWRHGYLNDPFLSGMQPVQCDTHLKWER